MDEGFWTMLCGDSSCSNNFVEKCSSNIYALINPHSCSHQVLVISVDILILLTVIYAVICRSVSRKLEASTELRQLHFVNYVTCILSGILGLAYFSLGVWTIVRRVDSDHTVFPLLGWLVILFEGLIWFLLCAAVGLMKLHLRKVAAMKFCSIIIFLLCGLLCVTSITEAFTVETVSIQMILDALSFPEAILFLISCFKGPYLASIDSNGDAFYELAPDAEEIDTYKNENVTPLAKAGFFSKMTFWWLNSLMKKGKEKILKDEDIPLLRKMDRAKTCYLSYMAELRKRKERGSADSSLMLSIIFSCHRKELLISGLFALTKVLALSTGPLFLKAFIEVAQGNVAFKHEAFVLTVGIFSVKSLESLSERQWSFRTKLIGTEVRSMLCAAIYQKQLHFANIEKEAHSSGQIVNYVTADAYRIGEFPFWFHQIWSTTLQLFLALFIVYYAVGLATLAALSGIVFLVIMSFPLIKLQINSQTKLMVAEDKRLKAISESLANIKVLKLYAWETHFKNIIDGIRKEELQWIARIQYQKGFQMVLFWSSPVLVPALTFWTCYFLGIQLNASGAFMFLSSLRLVQEPVRLIPDIVAAYIEAKVSLDRIMKFLDAPELKRIDMGSKSGGKELDHSICMRSSEISWDTDPSANATLRNINFVVKSGEKLAICGEVGSGKSTLLAAILGEVPRINGTVNVYGRIAYVSQSAWIQTGTIQENILFGSAMDQIKYNEVLERCSLLKDIEILPFGDLTQIGEKGVNLSGGQKQRVQLARALYQNADIYLLDDPFSAVDAHTATDLFNEYVMGALLKKTVLLVTHQVDFLPAFNSILLMYRGEIIRAASYDQLLIESKEFQDLVNAHKKIPGPERQQSMSNKRSVVFKEEIQKVAINEGQSKSLGDQLIKREERESGDVGLKPYLQYLKHNKGFLLFSIGTFFHFVFILGQGTQSYWLASNIQNPLFSRVELYTVYTAIGCILAVSLLLRAFAIVALGCGVSKSIFDALSSSLFRAPMSFYDSTPLGRILSRVSSDLSIIDIDMAFKMTISLGTTMNTFFNFAVLVFLAWPVVFVIIPVVYIYILLERYYFATSKELMRINGTTKSTLASHLAESISGAMTIRAFRQENRFFSENLDLIDKNASAYFHCLSATEWLIQRLEMISAIVLSSSALAIALLNHGASSSGFVGMLMSYGLSMNVFLVVSVQYHCILANHIVSVERLEQYMHIPSEAPEIIESSRPMSNWPAIGNVEICDLKVRYRPNAPFVLRGISCTFEGGHKIGIVGRTGSGKTTLISALFRLVEPTEGKIIVDDLDISTIGLHDLRSHFAIIPQEPTLFVGTVRYNLDPLTEHTDQEIWEVLKKCHLQEAIQEKEGGLNCSIAQEGSNWSMGQRQLFCLGRALLKRSRIIVLDEATASVDNATDAILQNTIRTEFADCTVITVAHRIPTVMDCNRVLAISDGKLVEYDEPLKLMNKEVSLFGELVKEYWSRIGTK